ncbi:MAG: hypothetical protein JXQ68_02045 [Campylobacterales bacterium]|nr:hypothetical protein [Campylobacterales bacterium]
MKKEFLIFIVIFLILSISIHFDAWISHPIAQIEALPKGGALGLGIWHPLIFAFLVYIVVWIFRLIGSGIKKIFRK